MSKKMKKDHARVPSGASRGQTHNFLSTNLPAAILVAALLIFWQAAAMGIDAAYICRHRPRWWYGSGSLEVGYLRHTFRQRCRWWGSDF